jgi:anti-sigma28 factor (negative regulator of flagellin synthesis)
MPLAEHQNQNSRKNLTVISIISHYEQMILTVSGFLGATSENSEDKSEELAQTKNDEMTGSGETLHSRSQVANTMSVGEQRALHNRIESLEHELKVRFEKVTWARI